MLLGAIVYVLVLACGILACRLTVAESLKAGLMLANRVRWDDVAVG